jgi:hypothetical protein
MFDRLRTTRLGTSAREARRPMHPLEKRAALARTFSHHLYLSTALLVIALSANLLAGRAVVSFIVGAALSSCLFALLAAVAVGAVRQEAIDAIARGEGHVTVGRFSAQLANLTGERNRRALARTLAVCLEPAPRFRNDILSTARARFLQDPSLTTQLNEVINQLRHGEAAAIGVAQVHQLITEARSPLYSGSTEELRRRLGQIHYLLATDDLILGSQAAQPSAPFGTSLRER